MAKCGCSGPGRDGKSATPTSSPPASSPALCRALYLGSFGEKKIANECMCTFFFFPQTVARRLALEGKVFDSFFLGVTASCHISCWVSVCARLFHHPFPTPPTTPFVNCDDPYLHPVTCVKVSGRAGFVWPYNATPTTPSLPPPLPGFTSPSPGIMRTWRRRKNFAFLLLAFRVWCLSTATEHADAAVLNTQEGE